MLKTLASSFLARHRAARLTHPTRLAAALMGCCLMAVLLLSCSSDENEYCSYPCRFVFNTQRHGQSAALMGATSGTGVFCKVTTTIRGGAQYYRFENNAGLTDNVIFTQEDKQTTVLLEQPRRPQAVLCLRRRVSQLLLTRRHTGEVASADPLHLGHGVMCRLPPPVQPQHGRQRGIGRQRA